MTTHTEHINARGLRLSIQEEGKEIARARLYILENDLHDRPFGLLEDVWVDEEHRGRGHGSTLVAQVIGEAKHSNCYKLICTSRNEREEVHEWYKTLGFNEHGKEFRINF